MVDASVLANVLADDGEDGRLARDAVRHDELVAPDLIDVETVAVLRRRWLGKDLTAKQFRIAVQDLADIPLTRHPTLRLMRRAYELRANVTPHDAAYVGLAEVLQCPLITAHRRLATAPGPRCEIRLL